MRVTLIHNDSSGRAVSLDQIGETLARHGHELAHVLGEDADVARHLADEHPEVVLAAGGDGTVAAAARALAGQDVPLAILPLGTANNIARSLGRGTSLDEVIASWGHARQVDVGVAEGPWGRRRFIESVGMGLVPAGIAAMDRWPAQHDLVAHAQVEQAVRAFRDSLPRLDARRCHLALDGVNADGPFLLVEVMIIRSIGPNLVLAHDADPSDGLFSVVVAGEQDRDALMQYFDRRLAVNETGGDGGDEEATLRLPVRTARQVRLQCEGPLHVDDRLLDMPDAQPVSLHLEPGALRVLGAGAPSDPGKA
ncbi:MAG: diacylglycerol kinase family protein [Vicinamibacterales bacterium]